MTHTVAHLAFNFYDCDSNSFEAERRIKTGYKQVIVPGEGEEVREQMEHAIKNYAGKYGLFDVQTITPEQYEDGLAFQEKTKNKKG